MFPVMPGQSSSELTQTRLGNLNESNARQPLSQSHSLSSIAGRLQSPSSQYALAFIIFAVFSLLNFWLQRWIGYQAIALLYLLSVVLLALFAGRGATLFGTTLTAFGWGFAFAPPKYSFHIAGFYDQAMLAMYFIVALTVGQLTARLRAERLAEQEREARARALYHLTDRLAAANTLAEIATLAVHEVARIFGNQVALSLPSPEDNPQLVALDSGSWSLDQTEREAAALAFKHNKPAGPGTELRPDASALHFPLSAGSVPAGVLSVGLSSAPYLTQPRRELLANLAQQIALLLDRQRLRETEAAARLLAESERLGRTLLNSVSHELRTPIAAITGAASSLQKSSPLNPTQQQLSTEIESAANRLNRVVQSLLSAARVQAGQVRPEMDWCDLSDVVRAALRGNSQWLGARSVRVHVAASLPLVKADYVLVEQALGNLLLNAAVHTPAGTPVDITARLEGREVILEVADRGPGLPSDQLERVFDSFHRTPLAKPGGTGLGLAIVKGFVEAQGGRAWAANRTGGGAVFGICLPVGDAPRLPDDTL